jgi:hypothetical protein
VRRRQRPKALVAARTAGIRPDAGRLTVPQVRATVAPGTSVSAVARASDVFVTAVPPVLGAPPVEAMAIPAVTTQRRMARAADIRR